MSKWEKIEKYLNRIHQDKIKGQRYYMFGYQEQYKQMEAINLGYLPFYDGKDTKRDVEILPDIYKCNRPGIQKTCTKYICIHDTASGAPTATTKAHRNWLMSMATDPNNKNSVSWHFTVDENAVFQHLPTTEVAHHAGDGYREWGTTYHNNTYDKDCITGGNLNSVGIETCVNYGSDYTKTMRRTAKLVAELLLEFDLKLDAVKQHNDFSGKDCPMTMRHAGRWGEFLSLVDIEYIGKTEFKDVNFTWKSLTPEILDDKGNIVKHIDNAKVEYEVKVEYMEEEKTYRYVSYLEPIL
ncbi:MAG: N-acetylmuramoyl-L-alanine amidase [Bacilli bacterium]|nr:N-acetylmuramoyl-L-alanine amidase [Bacilli bacterium]